MNRWVCAALAVATLASAAPAWACFPETVNDAWAERQARYGPVTVARVIAVRTIPEPECRRRAGDRTTPEAPGPISDNCNHPLGVADVRIERVISGEASGMCTAPWGEHLQCRNTFIPHEGDLVILMPFRPVDDPIFGRVDGWAIGSGEASTSGRLAAALGVPVVGPEAAQ